MRERRTVTIENSAATKKALIAISNSTDSNRDSTSVKVIAGKSDISCTLAPKSDTMLPTKTFSIEPENPSGGFVSFYFTSPLECQIFATAVFDLDNLSGSAKLL